MNTRFTKHLLHQYGIISTYVGTILLFIGVLILVPLLLAIFYPCDTTSILTIVANSVLLLATGLLLRLNSRKAPMTALDFGESSIVVFTSWLLITLYGTIPFIYACNLSFTQAMFESVSGWTTTGLSVLDLNSTSRVILFFRAWTQFLGGAGMAIIVIASLTGINANQLYSAEGKGNLIKPHVISSARIVLILYSAYLLIGVLGYVILQMDVFDALIHCFTAISTGGFGNYSSSIGYFDSPKIELLTMVLMILGNLNFVTAYLLAKRKILSVIRSGEVKLLFALLTISIPLVLYLNSDLAYSDWGRHIRIAAFETVSAITTTGFTITNYNAPVWSEASIMVLILLMLIGGGACSTAGGIKQYRIYIILKSAFWHIRKSTMPANAVVKSYIWENEQKDYISDHKMLSVSNFVFLYMLIYSIGSLIIACSTDPSTGSLYSMRDAMFEFASSLGTVGLSVGVTNAFTPVHVLWTMTSGMLLGRLEFYVIIIALAKIIKDMKGMVLAL